MTKQKIIREPLKCCGRSWSSRPECEAVAVKPDTHARHPLWNWTYLASRGQCAQSATVPTLHAHTDQTKHLWLLHIEFHISDPEMCTGLCVQLEKYTIWNFCWLEKERRVQILYALGKSGCFSAQGRRFTHVDVARAGFHENCSPTELRIRSSRKLSLFWISWMIWQTLKAQFQACYPSRGARQRSGTLELRSCRKHVCLELKWC